MWFNNGFEPVTNAGLFNGIPKQNEQTPINLEFSFTPATANCIKERDNRTCGCGRSEYNAWRLDASHLDHNKKNPNYNNPDNGVAECKMCHTKRHIDMFVQAEYQGNEQINRHWARASLRLLAMDIWSNGLQSTRSATFQDRQELNTLFEAYGVDIGEFVDLTKMLECENYGGGY